MYPNFLTSSKMNVSRIFITKLETNFSPKSKAKQKSASALFDSVLITPVTKLSNKLKKRPSFVDDEKSWNPELVQILGWVIFSLVLVCLIVMFLITYATFKGPLRSHFVKEEAKTQPESLPPSSPPSQDLPEFTGLQQEFLLDKDVTFEEVIEMKRVLEEDGNVDEEVFVEEDIFYNDVPVPAEGLYEHPIQFVDPSEATFKPKTSEESQQIILKAEEILERETKLLEEVSKKLDEFVAHSKSLTNPIDIDRDTKKDEGVESVDSSKMDSAENELEKSKPRGKRTKNKNPLTKSIEPKMSKAKIKKLPTATTPTSIEPSLALDNELERKKDNSGTDEEEEDVEEDREEGEDYDSDAEAGPGEERVKRGSRSGSRFGRSRVRMMSFRKRSGLDKSRDSNDMIVDTSKSDD